MFGAQNHPATTVKTPHLSTPEDPYTILDLPWSTATTGAIEDYLDVFQTFFEHETFTLDVPRRELSISGVYCHQKCHVPLQVTQGPPSAQGIQLHHDPPQIVGA